MRFLFYEWQAYSKVESNHLDYFKDWQCLKKGRGKVEKMGI
jgi:hypothetical protein